MNPLLLFYFFTQAGQTPPILTLPLVFFSNAASGDALTAVGAGLSGITVGAGLSGITVSDGGVG